MMPPEGTTASTDVVSSVDVEWRRRYDRARAKLLDVRAMRAMAERIAAAGADPAQELEVVRGGDRLGSVRRVAVFMGSFNPLTVAHTSAADAARAALRLDALIWGIAAISVNKERVERASLVDRVVQITAHVGNTSPGGAVAVFRPGLYAGQSNAVRANLTSDAELWFLVGFDKVVQIFDPRYYQDREAALRELFGSTRLLVIPRGEHRAQALGDLLAREQNARYASAVRYLEVAPSLASISSSAVRKAVADLGDSAAADPTALAGMLAPEGAALALVTGAYSPPIPLADGHLIDRYAEREAALAMPVDGLAPEASD